MALVLYTKDPKRNGNAILYGGGRQLYGTSCEVNEVEVYLVETDFGNFMTLQMSEVEELFTFGPWRDYGQWRRERDDLRAQPIRVLMELI